MSALLSLCIKNLEDAVTFGHRRCCTIPALSEDEAFGIGSLIAADQEIIKNILLHICCALYFEPDFAKTKSEESCCKC